MTIEPEAPPPDPFVDAEAADAGNVDTAELRTLAFALLQRHAEPKHAPSEDAQSEPVPEDQAAPETVDAASDIVRALGIFRRLSAADSDDAELRAGFTQVGMAALEQAERLQAQGETAKARSVFARLTSPSALDAFKSALTTDPRLQVDVDTSVHYFSKQSEGTSKAITIIGIVVGVIMAIGAIFGALNTMFAAVATRAREIATLRAIGFRGLPVVVAVMLETMLLALLGGVLGGLVAWLAFNGYSASTLTMGSTGQLMFQFNVSPSVLWTGIKWALAIGFVGGLYPALRAARLPVTVALREQ